MNIESSIIDLRLHNADISLGEIVSGTRDVDTTKDVITDSEGQRFEDERLIAYRLPEANMRTVRYLENQELKQVEKALKKVWHQRFYAHDEAVSAILDALDGAEEPICRAVVEYIQDPMTLKEGNPAWMGRIHECP